MKNRGWLPWLGIFLAVALAYGPAGRAGFIWNDADYVTAPGLQSLDGLWRIWTQVGATEQYYPVLHSAFWLQHRLLGDAPAGYHVVNIFWHALAAGLFALALRRLAVPGAWLAGFLFALHPVAVESVAWISEQKNTLSLVLYLAAALAYLAFAESRRSLPYAVASGFFGLALLCKSVTATLPAALLLVGWWRHGALEWRRDVRPLAPWLLAGAGFGLFTAWVEHAVVGARGAAFDLSWLERALLAGRVSWFYLAKLAWPADLIFIYPRWDVDAAVWWQWLFPLALLVVLGGLWAWRTRSRAPLTVALFFLGSLFPVMGFFNVYAFQFSYVADHWQYLPMLGPLAGVAALVATRLAAAAPGFRRPAWVVVVAGLGLLGFLSRQQTGLYRDIETFYRETLAANPASWMGHNNLGLLLAETGRAEEGVRHLRAALRLNPDRPEHANNLGTALRATGDRTEAIACFRRALALKPAYPEAEFNLALALAETGQAAEATEHYRRVLALRPHHAKAANNLGNLLLAEHDSAGAQALFEQAIRAEPGFADAHHNLGVVLLARKQPEPAAAALQQALALDPARDTSRWMLAVVCSITGRKPEAQTLLEELIRRQPRHADAHLLLAQLLWESGRRDEALRHRDEGLRLQPAGGPPPR